jgi:predicted RNase H-like HicB family nuclease
MDTALLFTGVILNDGDSFSAICIDTDIASDGISADEAKRNLIEAVNLYIESALENNLPIIRPVPSGENPLHLNDKHIVSSFKIHVDLSVHTYA